MYPQLWESQEADEFSSRTSDLNGQMGQSNLNSMLMRLRHRNQPGSPLRMSSRLQQRHIFLQKSLLIVRLITLMKKALRFNCYYFAIWDKGLAIMEYCILVSTGTIRCCVGPTYYTELVYLGPVQKILAQAVMSHLRAQ